MRERQIDSGVRGEAGLQKSHAVAVDGIRINFVRAGAGRPLVLVHGLTGSVANWRRNIQPLASCASVYAVDLANMGCSARVPGLDAGLAATADRVVAWMDAVGLGQVDLAGHSHGGAVSMMLAARHPERIRSLVLFAPANPFSDAADRLVRFYGTALGRQFARIAPFLPRSVQMIALGRMYGDRRRITPDCLDGYVAGLQVPGTVPHLLNILRNWFGEMEALEAALPRLAELPVLLVWGDRDRAVSLESGWRLHGELPRSEMVVIPGVGHIPFEEAPAESNRLLLRWLDRLEMPRHENRTAPAVTPAPAATRGRRSVPAASTRSNVVPFPRRA